MPLRNVRKWSRYLKKTAFDARNRHFARQVHRVAKDIDDVKMERLRGKKQEAQRSQDRALRAGGLYRKNVRLARKIVVETAIRNQGLNRKLSPRQLLGLKKASIRLLELTRQENEIETRLRNKYGKNIPQDERLYLEKTRGLVRNCVDEIILYCGKRAGLFVEELMELAAIGSQAA